MCRCEGAGHEMTPDPISVLIMASCNLRSALCQCSCQSVEDGTRGNKDIAIELIKVHVIYMKQDKHNCQCNVELYVGTFILLCKDGRLTNITEHQLLHIYFSRAHDCAYRRWLCCLMGWCKGEVAAVAAWCSPQHQWPPSFATASTQQRG